MYLLNFCIYLIYCFVFFLFVGSQQTKQIAHVMTLNQDNISKGKVTSAFVYFTKRPWLSADNSDSDYINLWSTRKQSLGYIEIVC